MLSSTFLCEPEMALRLLRFYPLRLRNLLVEVALDSNHTANALEDKLALPAGRANAPNE